MIYSCGVVPVRFAPIHGGPPIAKFLLLRSYHHWDFPKGRVEEGESDQQAALREFAEETGIGEVPAFNWGYNEAYSTEPYSSPKKIARYFVGEVSNDAEVKLLPNPESGRVEHQEFRWCGADEARQLLKPRIVKALDFAINLICPESK